MSIFDLKINELDQGNRPTPESFQGYLKRINWSKKISTAECISIQTFEDLRPELKEASYMVLRLGKSSDSKGTQFSLIKTDNWSDYFLFNSVPTNDVTEHRFENDPNYESFRVINKLTESSFINLLLHSKVLLRHLNFDSDSPIIPATSNSTHSFIVKPHSKSDIEWLHDNGQVEVDNIFTAKRGGENILCIIEAKSNKSNSLAKHKLVYPILSIQPNLSKEYKIIPLYIRINKEKNKISFQVIECSFPQDINEQFINKLTPVKVTNFSVVL
ncbi:MAG: hypothetical protein CME63_16475 [Halobacteriovoraceae bacterium]|nr:hypothetical protein [Halobacteriovoraceae bacterium]|tara:strand:- start:17249 stop:18064 length:816 start_codon:yes stop_codon:yes gene_type:complete